MNDIVKKVNMIKVLKIAGGACAAILLAELFGLKYAASAGIITLLSIQDTKKETINIAFKRVIAFILSIIISYIVFNIIGYNAFSFAAFLIVFIVVCNLFSLQDAISMCAVLATHYLIEQKMDTSLIGNEVVLMGVGVTLGIVINLFIPSKQKTIIKDQQKLEEDMKIILYRMSKALLLETRENYDDSCFVSLEEHIEDSLTRAYQNMNNTLLSDTRYYIDYIKMRKTQCEILRGVYAHIILLRNVPKQAHIISEYIRKISQSFHEYNNAIGLLNELQNIRINFKKEALPTNRDEFESRAVLFLILHDFELFLVAKSKFVQSLSQKQIKEYWKDCISCDYTNSINME